MGFRQWMRELLADRDWTQEDAAEAMGTRQSTISCWLLGIRSPGLDSCERISDAIGVPMAQIVEMVRVDARDASAAKVAV